ncbi:hypothetical protein [Halorarius litoreus]|uniref:hypothetical protein n=1 Tax=Halorarius litoreus TaxID=2962676 RepID=UPI0020CE8BEC|nr:hypothetical protein [Halorarius litoreus]
MDSITENFEPLADTGLAMDAGIVLASYAAPSLYGPTVESMVGMDIPNELYGAAHIVGAEMWAGGSKRAIQIGGMVYTIDQLAHRFQVRQRLQNAAGGN